MSDDLSWLVIVFALLLFLALVVEVYMATFLASWFGFSGLLWWVCAILIFGGINGLIGVLWRL